MTQLNEPRQLTASRVNVYDWLRLIATLLVVIGHSTYLDTTETYGGILYALPENTSPLYFSKIFDFWRNMVTWIYTFHMPLFFMLSGAVLALKPIKSLGSVIKSKFIRLLLPYFIYGYLFMFPVKRLGDFYDDASIVLALRGFLLGQDSGHLWFLPSLFWVTIFFAVIQRPLSKLNIQSGYALLFLSGVVMILYTYLPFDVLFLKHGLTYLFYFTLGYAFESERQRVSPWSTKTALLTFLALVALDLVTLRFNILDTTYLTLSRSLLIYSLAYLLDCIFRNIHQQKWWKVITRNLFYIYLFHDPLEYVVIRIFFGTNLLASPFGCIAYAFCRIVVVTAISILLGESANYIKKYQKTCKYLNFKKK